MHNDKIHPSLQAVYPYNITENINWNSLKSVHGEHVCWMQSWAMHGALCLQISCSHCEAALCLWSESIAIMEIPFEVSYDMHQKAKYSWQRKNKKQLKV